MIFPTRVNHSRKETQPIGTFADTARSRINLTKKNKQQIPGNKNFTRGLQIQGREECPPSQSPSTTKIPSPPTPPPTSTNNTLCAISTLKGANLTHPPPTKPTKKYLDKTNGDHTQGPQAPRLPPRLQKPPQHTKKTTPQPH